MTNIMVDTNTMARDDEHHRHQHPLRIIFRRLGRADVKVGSLRLVPDAEQGPQTHPPAGHLYAAVCARDTAELPPNYPSRPAGIAGPVNSQRLGMTERTMGQTANPYARESQPDQPAHQHSVMARSAI